MDRFSPIDQITAATVAQEVGDESEQFLQFIQELSASFREGKLFIEVPKDVGEFKSDHVVVSQGKAYFTRAWRIHESIRFHYQRLLSARPNILVDELRVDERGLFPDQVHAIQEALKRPLFCIWGGPGTGKTYTARRFYEIFSSQAKTSKKLRIALTAPTGKAALNLAKSLEDVKADVKTLHALLELRSSSQGAKNELPLPYDLLIVDESSMIDAAVMATLLSRLVDGTRVLFLGDPDQLPPVEPGAPFSDFVEAQGGQGRLTTCRRTDLQPILELAARVSSQKADETIAYLKEDHEGISFRNLALEEFYEAVKPVDTQQILSPLKIGPFGSDGVNKRLRKLQPSFEPVVITKNDYQLGLSNGDIGNVKPEGVYFGDRLIPKILLSSYDLAYCLSVHKSQGSEFDSVILLLPPGSERFGWKMFYTAITRAKKSLEIWSTEETIRAVLQR